ncbi:MAG: AEC family transporter [Hyphomicrobiaceae bacterium]
MLSILTALAPVFLIIGLGYLLHRSGLVAERDWSALEHLTYYLLFPSLIVKTLATTDFSGISLIGLVAGFLLALTAGAGLLLLLKVPLCRVLGLSDAGYTSLFQGTTRWHGFIALSIIAALFGASGVAIVSVCIAALVPLINVANILVLIRWGDRPADVVAPRLMQQIVKNPFIIACLLGAIANASGLGLPEPVGSAVGIISGGALGMSLLIVGAGLRPLRSTGEWGAVAFSAVFRLIVMPTIFFLCLTLFGIDGEARTFGTICGGVPTAAAAYVLARKMGGDAPLMASMTTAQVMAASVTLPVLIYVLKLLE